MISFMAHMPETAKPAVTYKPIPIAPEDILPGEEWKPVETPGAGEAYSISSLGRLFCHSTGRFRRPRDGMVDLFEWSLSIGEIVMEAFQTPKPSPAHTIWRKSTAVEWPWAATNLEWASLDQVLAGRNERRRR